MSGSIDGFIVKVESGRGSLSRRSWLLNVLDLDIFIEGAFLHVQRRQSAEV